MKSIDLNCDIGESFGPYIIGDDDSLMDYVSSVNIACGFHAGDPSVMRKTVALAVKKKVAIGAHPGYPDLQGFGRRDIRLSDREVYEIVLYQIGALNAFVTAAGARMQHVKPHGALYNAAAKDTGLAVAIASAVHDADKNLILVGLSGSSLIEEAAKLGLKTLNEVFSDRTYQDDGTLTPRSSHHACIEDEKKAAAHVLQMVKQNTVTALSGKVINVKVETICIHGDGHRAVAFAREIVNLLQQNNVSIGHP